MKFCKETLVACSGQEIGDFKMIGDLGNSSTLFRARVSGEVCAVKVQDGTDRILSDLERSRREFRELLVPTDYFKMDDERSVLIQPWVEGNTFYDLSDNVIWEYLKKHHGACHQVRRMIGMAIEGLETPESLHVDVTGNKPDQRVQFSKNLMLTTEDELVLLDSGYAIHEKTIARHGSIEAYRKAEGKPEHYLLPMYESLSRVQAL